MQAKGPVDVRSPRAVSDKFEWSNSVLARLFTSVYVQCASYTLANVVRRVPVPCLVNLSAFKRVGAQTGHNKNVLH